MKCILCRRKNERSVCDSCWNWANRQLVRFPARYNELERALMPEKGNNERVGGTKTPPLPVRLETLHLRTGGISKVLMTHEANVRKIQLHTQITFRGDELKRIQITCNYLGTHSEWIFENYPDVDKLAHDIIDIHNRINYVLGFKSDEITIGNCPTVNEDGEACGTQLKIKPDILSSYGDIRCRVCDTVWKSEQWRLLGRMLEQNEVI